MNRRHFVRGHAVALLGLSTSNAWWTRRDVRRSRRSPQVPPGAFPFQDPASTTLRDPRMAQLALRILDAARSAGAQYADVRMTNTLQRSADADLVQHPSQQTTLGLSVRALLQGYWGWAATPRLTDDEGVRVAQLATTLAKTSAAHGRPRSIDLGTIPVVTGDWATPMKIDPFNLDLLELHYWCRGMSMHLGDLVQARGAATSSAWEPGPGGGGGPRVGVVFTKQERLFASTEGSLVTQTINTIAPNFDESLHLPGLKAPVQAGWEWIAEAPIVAMYEAALDRGARQPKLPIKPLEVGRYDTVFSAQAMAQILNGTFGDATQVDRALGYEANRAGTSYLGPDPFAHLGAAVAAPSITVMADRSMALGLATVKWDDEGVASESFPLVKDGVLVNYQTTREQAAWLASWYAKHGKPIQSRGCAAATDALTVTMQHTPNLTLQPGPKDETQDTLVQGLEHGLLIEEMNVRMDWQCLDGYCTNLTATEIRHGKPVAQFDRGAITFRSDQLWKDVQALGGVTSAELWSGRSVKGEPMQYTEHSVRAVPARIKQVALIDPTRKAS